MAARYHSTGKQETLNHHLIVLFISLLIILVPIPTRVPAGFRFTDSRVTKACRLIVANGGADEPVAKKNG
jgi:hypothetical protein